MATRRKTKVQKIQCRINPHAAGVDIGAREIFVAVNPDLASMPVRKFNTFTESLATLVDWLKSLGTTTVAMEATGVYWIPLAEMLEEAKIEVYLVNPRHVKNVSGRKTDVMDCQWIQHLHAMGLLSAAFRPNAKIRALRALWRQRDALVRLRVLHTQHMHKAMDQMNLQLHHVINDITGVTGMTIVEAILSGQRDARVLAKFRDPRIKANEQTLVLALTGDYREEHLFCLQLAYDAFNFTNSQIAKIDEHVAAQLALLSPEKPTACTPEKSPTKRKTKTPGPDHSSMLSAICGVDLTSIPGINSMTAETILSEIGNDLKAFPSVGHFCSWLCLCPNNRISGGRPLSTSTRPANNRTSRALRNSAQGLHHAKNELGDFYRRMRAKLGGAAAIVATAHKLARIVYAVLTTKRPYDPSLHSVDHPAQRQRRYSKMISIAKELGFEVTHKQQIA